MPSKSQSSARRSPAKGLLQAIARVSPTRFAVGLLVGFAFTLPVFLAVNHSSPLVVLFAFGPGILLGVYRGIGLRPEASLVSLLNTVTVFALVLGTISLGAFVPARAWPATYAVIAFIACFLADLGDRLRGQTPDYENVLYLGFVVYTTTALLATLKPRPHASWYVVGPVVILMLGLGGRGGQLLAAYLGRHIGSALLTFISAAREVIAYARGRGARFAFFGVGYLALVAWFAALHHFVWWHDRAAFNGLGANPGADEFLFLSIATIATVGDGRTSAASDWARLALGVELVVGFLWNTLVLTSVAAEVGRAIVAAKTNSAEATNVDPGPPSRS